MKCHVCYEVLNIKWDYIPTRESDQKDKMLLLLSEDEPPKTRSSQCTAHMTVIHFVPSLESRLKSYFDIWRKQETGF